TERGTIEVTAGLAQDGSAALVTVEDSGIGIREEDMGRLFAPFVRLDGGHGSIVPGTGLGLYLTRKLVKEVLKGEISATSVFGKGSRFEIRLPVSADLNAL
ncbi:MAG: ATP-binding protein, partial [Spirochaetaceae bacterium]|nr:ATP-binding protein [Spirochaetaceae bacterium]